MNKGVYGINAPGGVRETVYIPLATAEVLYLYHPFPRSPDIVNVVFLCTATDNGWNPGEEAVGSCNHGVSLATGLCAMSAPGLVRTHNLSSTTLYLPAKTTGVTFVMTVARWKVKLRGIWIAPV